MPIDYSTLRQDQKDAIANGADPNDVLFTPPPTPVTPADNGMRSQYPGALPDSQPLQTNIGTAQKFLDEHPVLRKALKGTGMAGGMLATEGMGGLIPALMGGGVTAGAEPTSPTDWGLTALNGVTGHMGGSVIENLATSPVGKALLHGIFGGANEALVNGPIRQATEGTGTSPLAVGISSVIPAAFSAMSSASAPTREATALGNPASKITPELIERLINAKKASDITAKSIGSLQDNLKAMETKSNQLAATPDLWNHDNYGDALTWAAMQRKINTTKNTLSGENQLPKMPQDDHIKNLNDIVTDLQEQAKGINDGTVQGFKAKQGIQSKIDTANAQIQDLVEQKRQGEVAKVRQDIQGQSSTNQQQTQKEIDGIQEEIKHNPMENVYLKSLVHNPDPTKPFSPETLVTNITKADSSSMTALYKYLNQGSNKAARVDNMQNNVVGRFFENSFDPNTKGYTGANQQMSAGGDFNIDKMEALFGPGEQGQTGAANFSRTVQDIRRLTEIQQGQKAQSAAWDKNVQRANVAASVIATPLSLIFYHQHPTATMAGDLATGVAINISKLALYAVQNPTFASALHNMVTNPGTRAIPAVISNYLKANGRPVHGGTGPTPPPAAPQQQGQQAPQVGPQPPQ